MNTIRARLQKSLQRHGEREAALARTMPGWRTRRHRRALIGVLAAASLPLIAGSLMLGSVSIWTFLWLWAVGFVVYLTAFTMLRILTGKVVIGFTSQLDERERELRHHATYRGFQVNIALLVGVLILTRIVANGPGGEQSAYTLMSVVLMLSCSTPTIFLGWTLPDDDPDDIAEELTESLADDNNDVTGKMTMEEGKDARA